MPSSSSEKTVDERLEKARLLNRISAEVLTMCKSVDKLLHAQHTSNLAHAVVCVQEIARENFQVVIALKWVVLLVDMLESDTPDVRLAACNALAAVSVAQEGRDAVRSCGGLRPLVMLLAEGSRSPIAAAAAAVLMNCSACDVCKVAIADCRGVPMLLGLLRESMARCNQGASSGSSGAGASASASAAAAAAAATSSSSGAGPGGGGGGGGGAGGAAAAGAASQEIKTPGDCRAAAYAAGALMNMGGVTSVQELMVEAGAVPLFESITRMAAPGDVVATRANFILSWLAVGTGTGLDFSDVADNESEADARRSSGQVSVPRQSGPGASKLAGPGIAGSSRQLLVASPGRAAAGASPAGKTAVGA